jgi:ribosome-binding protein aMBF1 (putative translation factor)
MTKRADQMPKKMRPEEAPSFETVLEGQLQDPEFRAEWERTALARAVANAVVRYRAERGLSQRTLAGLLGWKQPQVARLELGEHNPTVETLLLLTRKLKLRFAFAVGPPRRPFTRAPAQDGSCQALRRR